MQDSVIFGGSETGSLAEKKLVLFKCVACGRTFGVTGLVASPIIEAQCKKGCLFCGELHAGYGIAIETYRDGSQDTKQHEAQQNELDGIIKCMSWEGEDA